MSTDDRLTDALADCEFETLAIRAGVGRTGEQEHSQALFLTSSFVFRSAEEAAARFAEEEPGNVYSRFTNPTVQAFEARLAALEGGRHALGTASGMGAILSLCLALLSSGESVVAGRSLFGSTHNLFNNILARFGIKTRYADTGDLEGFAAATDASTRLYFVESPTNPLGEVADIEGLAALAHERGVLLVVDNCFCTPALQQPLGLGADIVIHSATKYLDGHGRCVGGALVTDDQALRDKVFSVIRTGGCCMSPFNAWVFASGLETLALRLEAHSARAQALAEWLEAQPAVARVHYPGLASHPQHALARRQQSGFGGIVAFELQGGKSAAFELINATEMLSITANLGDVKTTITHPATTTHGRLTPEQRRAAGVGDGLVRLAVGLEDVADIQRDLQRGLTRIAGSLQRSA